MYFRNYIQWVYQGSGLCLVMLFYASFCKGQQDFLDTGLRFHQECYGEACQTKVAHVQTQSPASRTDIRVGDILRSINRIAIGHQKGDESRINHFMMSPSTRQVLLEIERKPDRKSTQLITYTLDCSNLNGPPVYGIGVTILADSFRLDRYWKAARIQSILPGSPAEREGLQVGDMIFKVDVDTVSQQPGHTIPSLISVLLIHEALPVELLYFRKSGDKWQPFTINLIRENIEQFIRRNAGNPVLPVMEAHKSSEPADTDTDQDGIPDQEDSCPLQAGNRSEDPALHGCP